MGGDDGCTSLERDMASLSLQQHNNNESAANRKALELRERLASLQRQRRQARQWRLREETARSALEEVLWTAKREQQEALSEFQRIRADIQKNERFLEVARQWNVLNDAFHIWHSGPFGTINGMRLGAEGPSGNFTATADNGNNNNNNSNGRSPAAASVPPARTSYLGFGLGAAAAPTPESNESNNTNNHNSSPAVIKIQWTEINSALGQVALLLAILEEQPHAGIRYRHQIVPMGSTSRIGLRNPDTGKASSFYNLYYSDDSFQLFGRRNFNVALQSLLQCVQDAAAVVHQRDPTISFPHEMEVMRNDESTMTIGGLSVAYSGGNGTEWTRAMKYLLTNVKQLLNYRAFALLDRTAAAQYGSAAADAP